MPADLRRLSILTAQEIDDLYGLPRFTGDDRCLYFDLSASEHESVNAVHTTSAAVHLVLQLGYFKAKRQFFVYARDEVLDDLRHILRCYFPRAGSRNRQTLVQTHSSRTTENHPQIV